MTDSLTDRSGRAIEIQPVATCCFLNDEQCLIPATWKAMWKGPPADSYTLGCDSHIGHLLDPDNQHIVLVPVTFGQNQTGNVTITEERDGA